MGLCLTRENKRKIGFEKKKAKMSVAEQKYDLALVKTQSDKRIREKPW